MKRLPFCPLPVVLLGLPLVFALPALAAQEEQAAPPPLLFSVGLGLLAIGLGALAGRWIRDRAAKSLQKNRRSPGGKKRR